MTQLSSGSLTYEGVHFLFGEGTPFPVTGFKRGIAAGRVADKVRPNGDGVLMGVDRKGAPAHSLSVAVLAEGPSRLDREASVRDLFAELAVAWNAGVVRGQVGAVAELTIGERTAFGRPREFTPDDGGIWDGVGEASLRFDAVDEHWYGPEQVTRLSFAPVFTGGLPIPADVPSVLGGGAGSSDRVVTLVGDSASWPIFDIHGPIIDPWVDVPGLGRVVLNVTVPHDKVLRVDAWPWRRSVSIDGVPVFGAMSGRSARLSEMRVRPGSHRVVFGGHDPSGTSWLDVRVRPAFSSL